MRKVFALFIVVTIVVIAYSCKKKSGSSTGTVYLDLPATAYTYNTTKYANKNIDHKATLGRVLFYDTRLSLNNAISCASCHKQAAGFADNVAFSVGYEGRLTGRNSPMIANITGDSLRYDNITKKSAPLFWDGREDVLQNLIARPVTNHVEMGINDFNTLPEKLGHVDFYPGLFTNAYGDNTITPDRISECVAVFLASIRSRNTRFDQFMGPNKFFGGTPSNPGVFSAQEYNGYNLFISKYQCQNCHRIFSSYYTFSDFRDIGLDKAYADKGFGTVTGSKNDEGKFRTPGLRNIALSAPYMHDGRYKTLEEVIDHYSKGVNNSVNLDWNLKDTSGKARMMNISDIDKKALVAFLGTLTDYDLVTDPKFSNPFKVK
ncbi:MAG: cytochrome-c peroxidase [Flavipsychrobacter sp.]|jgi:cytochrome c peroxidase|nr:cytochrome-c peroxidase [Flavipsychrobacter sp.]